MLVLNGPSKACILKQKFKITTDTFVGKIIVNKVCFINSTLLLKLRLKGFFAANADTLQSSLTIWWILVYLGNIRQKNILDIYDPNSG